MRDASKKGKTLKKFCLLHRKLQLLCVQIDDKPLDKNLTSVSPAQTLQKLNDFPNEHRVLINGNSIGWIVTE